MSFEVEEQNIGGRASFEVDLRILKTSIKMRVSREAIKLQLPLSVRYIEGKLFAITT